MHPGNDLLAFGAGRALQLRQHSIAVVYLLDVGELEITQELLDNTPQLGKVITT